MKHRTSSEPRFAEVLPPKWQFKDVQQVAWSFSLDPEKRLVVVDFCGTITADEVAKYSKSLLARSDFKPTFSEIADLTRVTEIDLQADDFLKLADKIDPFWPEAKRAFVVRTAMQNYAARMHRILRSDRNINIFRSVEEALTWIGE